MKLTRRRGADLSTTLADRDIGNSTVIASNTSISLLRLEQYDRERRSSRRIGINADTGSRFCHQLEAEDERTIQIKYDN